MVTPSFRRRMFLFFLPALLGLGVMQAAIAAPDKAEGGTAASKPAASAEAAPANQNVPLLLKGRPDGTVEVWEKGRLEKTIAPGEIPLTAPGSHALQTMALDAEQRRSQELTAQEEAAKQAEAEQQAAEAAALQQQQAERAAAERTWERQTLENNAVTVLNGETGDYTRIVPLEALSRTWQVQAQQKLSSTVPALAQKTVSVFNRETGGYVRGVPLEAVEQGAGTNQENAR